MALSMIEKVGEDLYYFRPDSDGELSLDEKINNKSNKINKLLDEAVLNKRQYTDLSNEIMQYSVDCEQKGFKYGFAAGIQFIMQSMAKG